MGHNQTRMPSVHTDTNLEQIIYIMFETAKRSVLLVCFANLCIAIISLSQANYSSR